MQLYDDRWIDDGAVLKMGIEDGAIMVAVGSAAVSKEF